MAIFVGKINFRLSKTWGAFIRQNAVCILCIECQEITQFLCLEPFWFNLQSLRNYENRGKSHPVEDLPNKLTS